MNIIILLVTIFFGKRKGSDCFNNTYYYSKFKLFGRQRRWVLYKGIVESSKVHPSWENWIRHLSDEPLKDVPYKWSKNNVVNVTGTEYAFYPQNNSTRMLGYNSYKRWVVEDSRNEKNNIKKVKIE